MPATAPSGRRQIHGAARGAGGCFTWNNWWWGGALTCPWRDCSDDDAARVTLTGDGAEAGCAPDRPCRISTVTSGATFHVEQSRPSSGARNRSGVVADQYELAEICNVTQPRMTQIMNLLHLAPDIQEQILFLPPVASGRDAVAERHLRELAAETAWTSQRDKWRRLPCPPS